MKSYRTPIFLVFFITAFMSPMQVVHAVNTQQGRREKTEIKELRQTGPDKRKGKEKNEKKLDGLSLAAHIAVTTGIASFFLLPQLGLLFLPAGLIMGLIAWLGGRKRYENRRGRGLALAAVAIGGAFTLMIMVSFSIFLLTF